jgi:hypothetical protein
MAVAGSPEMRGSEVGDEWAEDDGVDALADREHGCDAGQERGRPEVCGHEVDRIPCLQEQDQSGQVRPPTSR